jgi:hypothetical protein
MNANKNLISLLQPVHDMNSEGHARIARNGHHLLDTKDDLDIHRWPGQRPGQGDSPRRV